MSQRLAHVTYKSLHDDHAAKTFVFEKKKKEKKGQLIRVKVVGVASEGLQVTS